MTTDEIIERLRAEAAVVEKEVPNTAWFLFGSAAVDAASAVDIDLLILCPVDEDAMSVRRRLAELCLNFPLHLFLVTRDEELELNFIATQSCRRIYPD